MSFYPNAQAGDPDRNQRWQETIDAWRQTSPLILAENYPRGFADAIDCTVTSGKLHVFAGPKLYAGEVINSFTAGVGSTGSSALTHSWWSLIDPVTLAVLCKTADDTGAWGSFAERTVTMGSPFVMPYSVAPYIGLVIVASTVPGIRGMSAWSLFTDAAPPMTAESTAGLTTPASLGGTAGALSANGTGSVLPWIGIA